MECWLFKANRYGVKIVVLGSLAKPIACLLFGSVDLRVIDFCKIVVFYTNFRHKWNVDYCLVPQNLSILFVEYMNDNVFCLN